MLSRRRDEFCCSSRPIFLAAGLAKWGRQKGYEREIKTKAAGRRNQTKESAATLLCLVNCAWICNGPQCVWRFVDIGLIRRVSVTIPVIALKLPSFTERFFSLNSTFCKLDTIAIASSAWQAFTPSVIDWSSFVFRCFRFFELVHVNKK